MMMKKQQCKPRFTIGWIGISSYVLPSYPLSEGVQPAYVAYELQGKYAVVFRFKTLSHNTTYVHMRLLDPG